VGDGLSKRATLAKRYGLAIAIIVFGLGVGALGTLYGMSCDRAHFGASVATAIVALGSGIILGGGVKLFLDSYQESKHKRDEWDELRERLLGDLRDVYLRTESARLMISANQSATVYGEQMQQLIGCQAALLKVKRSIYLRFAKAVSDESTPCFADVLGYLRALQNEFASNYKNVEDSQGTWADLCMRQLPVLCDLTACSERFSRTLVLPLNKIAAKLLEPGVPEHRSDSGDRTTDISVVDKEFDDQVEDIAGKIRDAVLGESKQAAGGGAVPPSHAADGATGASLDFSPTMR
jgi:hypothetical protein